MASIRLVCSMIMVLILTPLGVAEDRPDTGISGVYEVVVGVADAQKSLEYFREFGFEQVATVDLSSKQAKSLYGVESAAKVYRLQNGNVETHGLLRLIEWETPLGNGVGYSPPETIGQRIAVMRTKDIFRLHDVFEDMRNESEIPVFSTQPVYDDLYDMDEGAYSISTRRVGVREMAVHGEEFNHIFFQRYGYVIPGYGTIENADLQTSEITHNDFIIKGDIGEVTQYYEDVLGFVSENDPVLDGDWQKGPQEVFQMTKGTAHWYRGFVSPNNICGKLKFFTARDPEFVRDRSDEQRVGELGITMHTLYTPKLEMVHSLASDHDLKPTKLMKNEFGEESFFFVGPDGSSWQILEEPKLESQPTTEFKLEKVDN